MAYVCDEILTFFVMRYSVNSTLPSKWRSISLWLLTNFLGTGAVSIYIGLQPNVASDYLLLITLGGILALLFSLPVALALPFIMHWALAATATPSRIARLLLVLSGSFIITLLITFLLLGGLDIKAEVITPYATVYLSSSLLATFLLYQRWIWE